MVWTDGRSLGHVITKFSGMGRFIYPWCSAGALRARSSAIMMLSMSKPFPSRLTIHTSKGKPRGLVLLLFPWVDKQHSGANPHSDATRKKFFIRTLSAHTFFASHQNFGVALQCGAHLEMSHTSLFRDCCWLVAAVSSELQVRYVASQFVFSFFYPWFDDKTAKAARRRRVALADLSSNKGK